LTQIHAKHYSLSLGLPVLSQNRWSHSLNLNDKLKISLQYYSFASSLFKFNIDYTEIFLILQNGF